MNIKINIMKLDSKKKIWIIVAIVVAAITVMGTFACLGIFRSFDAQEYVSAILNQTMKGDVQEALHITEGSTEEGLYAQYEAGILSFVENSIVSGVEAGDELKAKYVETCKKVFADMKFEVQEAEKISNEKYSVPVTYQSSDVFAKFIASTAAESTRLKEKVENGEYRGTVDEINLQMQNDFLNNSYTLFEEAYKNMEFGEEETMVFEVTKGESGLFELEEAKITEFLVKILGLDEIQD